MGLNLTMLLKGAPRVSVVMLSFNQTSIYLTTFIDTCVSIYSIHKSGFTSLHLRDQSRVAFINNSDFNFMVYVRLK